VRAAAQLSEHTIRCVAEALAHWGHGARPQQAQTATASAWCARHFIQTKTAAWIHRKQTGTTFAPAIHAKDLPIAVWRKMPAGTML
jgi:hypothetical protein